MYRALKNTSGLPAKVGVDGDTVATVFDSWQDFLAVYKATDSGKLSGLDHGCGDENPESGSNGARPGWVGTTDAKIPQFTGKDSVIKACGSQWKMGLNVYSEMSDAIANTKTNTPKDRRRTRRWSDEIGDDICRDRLRSGQAFWRETRRAMATGPSRITIVVNVGIDAATKWRESIWRAAAAAALANKLEAANYPVRIIAAVACSGLYHDGELPHSCLVAVTLKKFGEPVVPGALINAMAGWAFRSAWFSIFASPMSVCGVRSKMWSSLGCPLAINRQHTKMLDLDENATFLMNNSITSKDSAIAAIKDGLKLVGCEEYNEAMA